MISALPSASRTEFVPADTLIRFVVVSRRPGDDTAGDPGTGVACGVCHLVVRAGVNDESAAIGVENGRRPGRYGDPVSGRLQMARACRIHGQGRQVSGVGPFWVAETVLLAGRIVVAPGRGEIRRVALAHRVDVYSMLPSGQPGHVHLHQDHTLTVLEELRRADNLSGGILH